MGAVNPQSRGSNATRLNSAMGGSGASGRLDSCLEFRGQLRVEPAIGGHGATIATATRPATGKQWHP
jgi:hypothetical protein